MTEEQAAICDTLNRFMSSSLMKDREAEIVALHGASVYAKARRIADEAISVPVNWSRATMDQGLEALSAMINARYPWLTKEARAGLAFGFTMTWK